MNAIEELQQTVEDAVTSLGRGREEDQKKLAELGEQVVTLMKGADEVQALKAAADEMRKEVTAALKQVRVTGDTSRIIPGRVFSKEKSIAFGGFIRNVHKLCKGQEVKDFDAQTDTAGGVLVPDTFHPEIISILETVGVFQTLCEEIPLGPDKNSWPQDGTGVTVAWTGVGKTITESEPTTGMIDMSPETLAALVDVPNQVIENAFVDIGNFLARKFIRAGAKEEERVLLKGTGIPGDGKITGILKSSNVTIVNMASGKTYFATLNYDNIIDLEAAVIDGALADAAYVMSGYSLGLIKKLKDTANMPIWHAPAGPEPASINGHAYRRINQMPVLADSAVSTTFIAFGDFRQGVRYGRRGGLRIDASTHEKFRQNLTVFRFLEDFAGQVVPGSETGKNPIAVLKTAAS